jgi:hypothetical protein
MLMIPKQGTRPHPSSEDKSDDKDVVTVGTIPKIEQDFCPIHAHGDGTWKEFLSQADLETGSCFTSLISTFRMPLISKDTLHRSSIRSRFRPMGLGPRAVKQPILYGHPAVAVLYFA